MATTEKIEIIRGEDILIEVTVTGQIITGWALIFAVAPKYQDTAVITKSIGSGITITDGAHGIFQVALSDDDTKDLRTGGYVWDVKRNDAGQEAVLSRGEFVIKPNVAP